MEAVAKPQHTEKREREERLGRGTGGGFDGKAAP